MQITGIEVLHPETRISAGALPGQKLELDYEDIVRISVGLEYQGSGRNVTLYGAIGKRRLVIGFDEIIHAEAALSLPNTPGGFLPAEGSVDILITEELDPGTYDIYCKIIENPEAGLPEVTGAIEVVGLPPTFTLIQETVYSYAYIYSGKVDKAIFECKTVPFVSSAWAADKFAQAIEDEITNAGGRIIEVKVYADITPVMWSNLRVEVTSTPLPKETAMAVGVLPLWAAIVIAALGIAIAVAIITWSVKKLVESFQHKTLSEKIKLTWSRETLIGATQDFEVYLNRSPTPVAELEQMSDQGLRDYCDELAEVIVPPGVVSWLPWLAIGGVALVGVGVAVVISGHKK